MLEAERAVSVPGRRVLGKAARESNMKKSILHSVLSVLLASASAFTGKQDFAILNLTPDPILSVHASPAGNDDWEEALLGNATLSPGESGWFGIEGYTVCDWDIKVVRKNAASGDGFYGIDLCTAAAREHIPYVPFPPQIYPW